MAEQKLEEKLPQIIEYFVKFYGEEYRERIADRLNNTTFVFAPDENADVSNIAVNMQNSLDKIAKRNIILGEETYKNLMEEYLGKGRMRGGIFVSVSFDEPNKPLCLCFLPSLSKLNNAVLFHELNHIIQSDIYINDNGFTGRQGLGRRRYIVDYENNTAHADITDIERDEEILYDSFDEIVNDYLSQKVLKIAEKDGLKIGKENSESIYSVAFPIMSKFIDNNINAVKKCFLEGKKKQLISVLGKDRFEKLANALKDFLDLEDEHGAEFVEIMEKEDLTLTELLKEKSRENLPKELRIYVDFAKKAKNIVDEVESDIEKE